MVRLILAKMASMVNKAGAVPYSVGWFGTRRAVPKASLTFRGIVVIRRTRLSLKETLRLDNNDNYQVENLRDLIVSGTRDEIEGNSIYTNYGING